MKNPKPSTRIRIGLVTENGTVIGVICAKNKTGKPYEEALPEFWSDPVAVKFLLSIGDILELHQHRAYDDAKGSQAPKLYVDDVEFYEDRSGGIDQAFLLRPTTESLGQWERVSSASTLPTGLVATD